MSVGHATGYVFTSTGVPNVADLDKAIAEQLKHWRIVTGVTLAYCAGYDVEGKTVFIDEMVPEFWESNGRKIPIWRGALFTHETTEKDYMLRYGEDQYDAAHSRATYLEEAYVRANGGNVAAYEEEFWAPIIEKCAKRKVFERVPKTLDLAPYHDSSEDDLIKKFRWVDL